MPSRRSRPTGSRSSSVGPAGGSGTATVLSTLRPDALPAWGWTLPEGAGTYHALFPRAWQAFEPEVLGVRLVGEQLSPVIAGDLESSALPVGVFEWWVENPGPDPLTVGIMLTWEDPVADHGVPAPAGAWHETIETHDVGGAILHAPVDAPSGLRGTFAVATSRAPGVTVTIRDRVRRRRRRRRCGPTSPPTAGSIPRPTARPSAAGEAIGVAVAATVDLAPGESRSVRFALAWDLPVVEFGAGRRWYKRYTRDWGRTGERAFDLASHALEQAPAWRAAIEAWQQPVLDVGRPPRLVQGGPLQRALLPRRWRDVLGGRRGRRAGTRPRRPGRFALLECLDYPFYDSVDVDFYASFAILRLFPELEARGIRDLLAAVAVDDPEIVTIEASGLPAPRKVGGTVPHDVGGPDDDPFYRPNRYNTRTSTTGRTSVPSSSSRSGATRWPPGPSGDALIRDAWPTVEALLTRLSARDRDGDGLPEHDGLPDQTYDTWPMHGPSAYGGSLWLGALAAAEAMAGRLGATESARRWTAWFERGQVAFDRRLWRGDHYAYDDGGGVELGQHHGRPAGRPVVRRRDRVGRPRCRATASKPRCGRSTG